MVFLHFPSNYTDEELMLQAKYAKLRKKKKALEEMKDPKPEPEKSNPHKRQLDPKDAKELAKKLIQSGKVNIKGKLTIEKTTFKRPRTLERKILSTGRSEGHGGLTPGYMANYPLNDSVQFEPFTPNNDPSGNEKPDYSSSPSLPSSGRFGRKGSGGGGNYSNSSNSSKFGNHSDNKKSNSSSSQMNDSGDGMNSNRGGHGHGGGGGGMQQQNKPKRGPTIFIQAQNITEDILKEQFSKFGKIINLKLNNPSVGFITFEKLEIAELAIQEMNGITIDDISYDVQFARRQPNIAHLINDASVSASWTALAASQSLKSNYQDSRQQVVYDEP